MPASASSAKRTNTKAAHTDYPILDILKERYSPRVFADRTIDERTFHALMEAVRWAASSSNEQPWRFIYAFKGSTAYQKIFNLLSDFNKKWAKNAPLLILTAYKEKFDNGKENFHALHDLGLSLGNMTAQAQSMGIALHHMAGVDWRKAQEVFNVPEGYHITTAIAVGYYGGDPNQLPEDLAKRETAPRKRMPQQDFLFEGSWG